MFVNYKQLVELVLIFVKFTYSSSSMDDHMFSFSHLLCLCCFLHFGCPHSLLMIWYMFTYYFKTDAPLLSKNLYQLEELDMFLLSSPSLQ